MSQVSVVIPAYRNDEQLTIALTTNLPFLKGCEVIVVNDYPDASVADVLAPFPTVQLIEHTQNTGFSGAVNTGIRAAHGDVVMLLNTDVQLHDDGYRAAVAQIQDQPQLFAVSFAQIESDGSIHGKSRLTWQNGLMHHDYARDTQPGPTAWAEASSAVFSAHHLQTVGLFDTVYRPFYWEDIDLSYRAWKAGLEVWFEPSITVTHAHEATIGSYFSDQWVKRVAYRNQILFALQNITDPELIAQMKAELPTNVLRLIRAGAWSGIMGMIDAYQKKVVRRPTGTRTDQEILSIVG